MKNFCKALCCCTCCCSKKQKEPLIPERSESHPGINDDEEVKKIKILPKDTAVDENKPNVEQNNEEPKENEILKEKEEEKKKEGKLVEEEKKEEGPVLFYNEKFFDENINDDNIFEEKYYREDEKSFTRFVRTIYIITNRLKEISLLLLKLNLTHLKMENILNSLMRIICI